MTQLGNHGVVGGKNITTQLGAEVLAFFQLGVASKAIAREAEVEVGGVACRHCALAVLQCQLATGTGAAIQHRADVDVFG